MSLSIPGTIHLSQQAKEQLVRLKRATGLTQWNVLCRWAFCLSLAEPAAPALQHIPADSNVELSWKVFAGENGPLYLALLRQRCQTDGVGTEPEVVQTQLRLHLHRGLALLAGDHQLRRIEDLLARAVVR